MVDCSFRLCLFLMLLMAWETRARAISACKEAHEPVVKAGLSRLPRRPGNSCLGNVEQHVGVDQRGWTDSHQRRCWQSVSREYPISQRGLPETALYSMVLASSPSYNFCAT